MEKQTVFIKRYPSKGELPSKEGMYNTNKGIMSLSKTFDWINQHNYTDKAPEYWLEEIELPSEEDIKNFIDSQPYYGYGTTEFKEGIEEGANFILNYLKSNTNETDLLSKRL